MTHAQTPRSQETSLRIAVIVRPSVRLFVCTMPFHGVIHWADDMRYLGVFYYALL